MKKILVTVLSVIFSFAVLTLFAGGSSPEAQALFTKAEESFKAKDLEKASGFLADALKKEPDNAVYRYILGKILMDKGEFLLAKENFDCRPIQAHPREGRRLQRQTKELQEKNQDPPG